MSRISFLILLACHLVTSVTGFAEALTWLQRLSDAKYDRERHETCTA